MKTTVAFSLALAGCLTLGVVGCGDDDDDNGNAAGSAGTAGTAGTGGAGGSAAGAGGTAGAAGDGTGTGPGATLKCTSSGKNAFETYGVAAFSAVNDSIIANVGTELTANGDKNLGPSFTNSSTNGQLKNDPAGFKKNLGDFLIFAYGGPANYKGRTMEASHTGLAITQAQYDYFIANIVVKALTDNGVPMDDVSSCFAGPVTDPAFVATIINR